MKKIILMSLILIATIATSMKFRSTVNQKSVPVTLSTGRDTSTPSKPSIEGIVNATSEAKIPILSEKVLLYKIAQLDEYLNRNDSYKNGSLSEELYKSIIERQSLIEKLSELQITQSQDLLGQK